MRRLSWFLTWFIGLFLFVDGAARLAGFAPYVEGTTRFGYTAWLAPWIGVTLAVSSVLMVIPRTSVLGLILVTGYLGGATATQVRALDPWFLFPIALAALGWLGLYLREPRLRALVPVKTE